jgi:hypothetical protein
MKRIAVLLVVVSMVAGTSLLAEESSVIDFTKLVADFPSDKPANNQATLYDFSSAAGSSFSAEDKAAMKTSLALEKWEVVLNSSANSVFNARQSFTKATKVARGTEKDKSVLGVRVYFPTEPVNAYAIVQPPFQIPAYATKTTVGNDGSLTADATDTQGSKFVGYGIVKNVGVLKSLSVTVFGNNFPHKLSVILRDQSGKSQEYLLGTLDFDGWKTMGYSNANYITDVRNRDLRNFPLYPQTAPLVAFEGFKIYKDASMVGGDFVTYIKDVSIVYDKAVLTLERDIEDENVWGILQAREADRRNAELQRVGQIQVLRFLESKKIDDEAARQTPATN